MIRLDFRRRRTRVRRCGKQAFAPKFSSRTLYFGFAVFQSRQRYTESLRRRHALILVFGSEKGEKLGLHIILKTFPFRLRNAVALTAGNRSKRHKLTFGLPPSVHAMPFPLFCSLFQKAEAETEE
jgi:hypothetical protein